MLGVILGKGSSLKDYCPIRHKDDFVISANDGYFISKGVKAIASTDSYLDIQRKRPRALDTPDHIPYYIRKDSVGWKDFARKRPNTHLIHTRAWNGNIEELTNPVHGVHTPFFCASIALQQGAKKLYFYGIDGGNFSEGSQNRVIIEINGLAKVCEVRLASSSELWAINRISKNSRKRVTLEGVKKIMI